MLLGHHMLYILLRPHGTILCFGAKTPEVITFKFYMVIWYITDAVIYKQHFSVVVDQHGHIMFS